MKLLRAFTLVEMIVVIAIMAILILVAVPNFLEAQTRAKISRVHSDLQAISTALEAYHMDHSRYPYPLTTNRSKINIQYVFELTTPVAYMTSVNFRDPFQAWTPNPGLPNVDSKFTYRFYNYSGAWARISARAWGNRWFFCDGYCLVSDGPGPGEYGLFSLPVWRGMGRDDLIQEWQQSVYDPTNGTISSGELGRFGGEARNGINDPF